MSTLVYGLGESGIAAAKALKARGEDVVVADVADGEKLRGVLSKLGVDGVLGATPEILNEGVERVITSPGIRPRDPILRTASELDIPVVSEVALGLDLLPPNVPTIAVTGTNGKTTVTDMLHAILKAADIPHAVAGNSWRALTGALEEVREMQVLVLEVSSFQLHYLPAAGFDTAALLNVRPDHLNWHASYEEYVQDKLRVFEGQGAGDLALVSATDPVGREAARYLPAEVVLVGGADTLVRDGELFLQGSRLLKTRDLPFTGLHNYENALFAAAAAERLGADPVKIKEGLAGYSLRHHRMEVVSNRGGILYVDDSKATNPAAVAAALESFSRPVVLILGGSEKYTDFGEVLPHLHRCRAIVCQGEAGPRIAGYLRDEGWGSIVHQTSNLREAVEAARSVSRPGDVVLLSPGCASFDQFAGYEVRGEAFAALAQREGALEP